MPGGRRIGSGTDKHVELYGKGLPSFCSQNQLSFPPVVRKKSIFTTLDDLLHRGDNLDHDVRRRQTCREETESCLRR
jgi:hypothetical protein